jgi:hypothetical protein
VFEKTALRTIPLDFFLKLVQIGLLDLIACTCSRGTLTSIRIVVLVDYNEYIAQKSTPISTNKLELIK